MPLSITLPLPIPKIPWENLITALKQLPPELLQKGITDLIEAGHQSEEVRRFLTYTLLAAASPTNVCALAYKDVQPNHLIDATFNHHQGSPTACVRCKSLNSAEGYYETGNGCRIGICRLHKQHGEAKIVWYDNSQHEELQQGEATV